MRSRLRLLGHPVHPMLVALPLALFPALLVLDLVRLFTGSEAAWSAGFWLVAFGALGALGAILTGIPDMAALRDGTRAHRIGAFHASVGTLILLAYAAGIFLRWPPGSGAGGAFVWTLGLDALGTLLVVAQGWLGGELVYRHHVGVPSARAEVATPEGGDAPARERRGERT